MVVIGSSAGRQTAEPRPMSRLYAFCDDLNKLVSGGINFNLPSLSQIHHGKWRFRDALVEVVSTFKFISACRKALARHARRQRAPLLLGINFSHDPHAGSRYVWVGAGIVTHLRES